MSNRASSIRNQHGTSLVEVLVTLLVVSFGLLGLVGLQSRMQLSEMESYQRSQALVLLNDMASRITVNRSAAAGYVTGVVTPLGGSNACPTSTATRPEIDALEWCNALKGAAEVTSGGTNAGAMIGARGCIESLPDNEYMVTVAWQGLSGVAAPPASVACGAGAYDGAVGSTCTNDRCRRVVTTVVRIATLD